MISYMNLPLRYEGQKGIFEHFSITERERRLRSIPRVTLPLLLFRMENQILPHRQLNPYREAALLVLKADHML